VSDTLVDDDDKHAIRSALLHLLNDVSIKQLIVDLSQVRYCSNEIVSDLLFVQRQLAQRDGNLNLCCMQPVVYEKLRELNLAGTVFTVYDSQAEALESVQID
jgi:anti-anti-sigma regulatory factor